jgi:hypothetical protein
MIACWVAWSAPAPAWACKCAPPPPVADALKEAAAVFEARVTKLTPLNSIELVVELNVVRGWKGADNEHVLLRTPKDSAACGIEFSAGESYLVYAGEAPQEAPLPGLVALRCGRTRLMSEAEEDLAVLGVGVVPVTPAKSELAASPPAVKNAAAQPREKPAAGGCASCSALGAAPGSASAALGIALLLGFAWRAQRRRAT